jgi:hypothetical protein
VTSGHGKLQQQCDYYVFGTRSAISEEIFSRMSFNNIYTCEIKLTILAVGFNIEMMAQLSFPIFLKLIL